MKFALINPAWTFEGSIYFGCREPHLPLEFGYAKTLIEAAGHEVEIVDGQLGALTHEQIVQRVTDYAPDIAVVTTAPSYLFWRCAPPELRLPQQLVDDLDPTCPALLSLAPTPPPRLRPRFANWTRTPRSSANARTSCRSWQLHPTIGAASIRCAPGTTTRRK